MGLNFQSPSGLSTLKLPLGSSSMRSFVNLIPARLNIMRVFYGNEKEIKPRTDVPYTGMKNYKTQELDLEAIKQSAEEKAILNQDMIKNNVTRDIENLCLETARKKYNEKNPDNSFDSLSKDEIDRLKKEELDKMLEERVRKECLDRELAERVKQEQNKDRFNLEEEQRKRQANLEKSIREGNFTKEQANQLRKQEQDRRIRELSEQAQKNNASAHITPEQMLTEKNAIKEKLIKGGIATILLTAIVADRLGKSPSDITEQEKQKELSKLSESKIETLTSQAYNKLSEKEKDEIRERAITNLEQEALDKNLSNFSIDELKNQELKKMEDVGFKKELETFKQKQIDADITAFKSAQLQSLTASSKIDFVNTASYVVDIKEGNDPNGRVIGRKAQQVVHTHRFDKADSIDPNRILNLSKLSGKELEEGIEKVKDKAKPMLYLTFLEK